MQVIDSSWEVQQGDKVHREFVRLVFEKQGSFEWRNLVTKDEKEIEKKNVGASEENPNECGSSSLKIFIFNGRFNIKCYLRWGHFWGIMNHEEAVDLPHVYKSTRYAEMMFYGAFLQREPEHFGDCWMFEYFKWSKKTWIYYQRLSIVQRKYFYGNVIIRCLIFSAAN